MGFHRIKSGHSVEQPFIIKCKNKGGQMTADRDHRRTAKMKYWNGFSIAQIAEELQIKAATISSWKKRDKWDEASPVSRIEQTFEARLTFLTMKETKSGSDFKEIDLLMRQLERTEKIKRYASGERSSRSKGVATRDKGGNKNYLNEEQVTLLRDNFLSSMFKYQVTWYKAGKHRNRVILKSRQIGATYYFAHEALIDALETGRNQIFISASKKQAFQFKQYMINYVLSLTDVKLTGEDLIIEHDLNGERKRTRLIFLGTNVNTAQGYTGNLYFDEIFWIPRFDEVRKAVSAVASHKQFRQTYFSTPSSKSHSAYPFWDGSAFNKGRKKADRVELDLSHDFLAPGIMCADGKWRQIVTIDDAEKGGCTLFDKKALILELPPAEFAQLYLCEFQDDGTSIFNFADLQACAVDSLEVWNDFNPNLTRPYKQSPVWIGYDPSFTGDRAALVVIAPPKAKLGKFRVLEVEAYRGNDFEAQAERVRFFTKKYNVAHIAIDVTGLGTGVYQLVKKFYPMAKGLTYNQTLKNEMILKAQNIISKRRIEFDSGDDNKHITAGFMAIRKQQSQSGATMVYTTDRSEEASHGDVAWATMQVLINEPFDGQSANSQGFVKVRRS